MSAVCAMCHLPIEPDETASDTDLGLMHDSPYTYDEGSCYDAYQTRQEGALWGIPARCLKA